MNWLITDKGDPWALRLVDGRKASERVVQLTGAHRLDLSEHYSRQQPGTPSFTRNGQNLVFITADHLAVWATHRPKPGAATRPDGLQAWECTIFRNEGPLLSSALIREAVLLTWALWGAPPRDGLITYVRPECVASGLAGYCYRRAGWKRVGAARDGKPMFRAPRPAHVPSWREWGWHGERGGRLRESMERHAALSDLPLFGWAA